MQSSRRRECLSAVAVAIALTACARPAPPRPAAHYETPRQVLAAAAAREAAIQTLRARFSARATQPDGSARTLSGALLVSKPTGQFRFRLMLPFGVTVLDYVHDGDGDWATLPLADDEAIARFDSLGLMGLARAFLADRLNADPNSCQTSANVDGLVDVMCGFDRMTLRAADATIAAQTISGGATLYYRDERSVSGILLPFAIEIAEPGGGTVAVAIDAYEVNPSLDAGAFDVPPAAHLLSVR